MSRGRGAILLEVLLSLALFVMTSLMLLSIISDSIDGLRRSRDRLIAADHARNAMSLIESGLARPESLHGPVAAWDDRGEAELDDSFIGVTPDDAPSRTTGPVEMSGWALEIETEPAPYRGLMLVVVRAHRVDGSGFESEGAPSFTLRQYVRLDAGAEVDSMRLGHAVRGGQP